MKKILKLVAFSTILLLLAESFFSCGEKDCQCNNEKVCNVENPLTDLLWLKEIIDGIKKNVETGYIQHARIYQCIYKDGIGFLLEPCVGCPDAGYSFRNCEGVVLCGGGGEAGTDNCSEFSIDFENKILIWEMTK